MNEVSNNKVVKNAEIGVIGALGGLSLALLKLIESGFFLDSIGSKEAMAAYLTYAVYIFFGVVVAMYFTDRTLARQQVKKGAFTMGLLAPSVLLALSIQPVAGEARQTDDIPIVNTLSSLLSSPVYAQEPPSGCEQVAEESAAQRAACVSIQNLRKKDLEVSFGEAVMKALGRERTAKKYTVVVGVTDQQAIARETAADINQSIRTFSAGWQEEAKILSIEGTGKYFVTIGDFGTKYEVSFTKRAASDNAISALTSQLGQYEKSGKLLLKSSVIERSELLKID